jgi:hypothetical protein
VLNFSMEPTISRLVPLSKTATLDICPDPTLTGAPNCASVFLRPLSQPKERPLCPSSTPILHRQSTFKVDTSLPEGHDADFGLQNGTSNGNPYSLWSQQNHAKFCSAATEEVELVQCVCICFSSYIFRADVDPPVIDRTEESRRSSLVIPRRFAP